LYASGLKTEMEAQDHIISERISDESKGCNLVLVIIQNFPLNN
jgi:hypothetical protein